MSLQDVDGNTALHLAARDSSPHPTDIARLLLRAKAPVDVVNKQGVRPLDAIKNVQVRTYKNSW